MPPPYTPKQGQYLAFIYYYTKLNGRPPAERDMQLYFKTTPPTVHQMVVTLEKRGLISRQPGQPRSIQVLLPRDQLPDLDWVLTPKHLQYQPGVKKRRWRFQHVGHFREAHMNPGMRIETG